VSDPRARPVINVEGRLVAIGPFSRDVYELYYRWVNDFANHRAAKPVSPPRTYEQESERFERWSRNDGDAAFTIYERAGWRPIGVTELGGINHRSGTAEFSIMIGEPAERGKGYGTETTRLVLDYGFTALGLHNIMLTVREYNYAARRAYEKAGFKEFGRRRKCWPFAGRWWDAIYMDILAEEFESPVLAAVLRPDEARASTG
jgi:RimJ/RimL family protein N-acetyltransferase